jgi:hypothetical protein
VDWIFFVDTLNFCFWSADKDVKWEVIWNAKTYTGYFALCAAVKRAHKVCYSLANSSTGPYVLYTKSKILQTPNWMFLGQDVQHKASPHEFKIYFHLVYLVFTNKAVANKLWQ